MNTKMRKKTIVSQLCHICIYGFYEAIKMFCPVGKTESSVTAEITRVVDWSIVSVTNLQQVHECDRRTDGGTDRNVIHSKSLSSLIPTQLAPKTCSLHSMQIKCKVGHNCHSRSFKVINFRPNWTPVCDFLLLSHSNRGYISHHVRVWRRIGGYPILTPSFGVNSFYYYY